MAILLRRPLLSRPSPFDGLRVTLDARPSTPALRAFAQDDKRFAPEFILSERSESKGSG
jgi:hypothetical protein